MLGTNSTKAHSLFAKTKALKLFLILTLRIQPHTYDHSIQTDSIADFRLFSSSQLQTLQFLESLSHFLLASCTIRPLKDSAGPLGEASSSSSSPRLLSLALENEAIAIKRAATSLLLRGGEEEARRGGGAPPEAARESADDDDEGQRSGHRQEWERDLGWSRRSLSAAPVDTAHYCSLTRRLSAVRLEADLAALLQARRGAS